MFKTMDGVPVYDKYDIDNSLGLKDPDKGTAFERIDALEANEVTTEMLDAKADKSYAEETRQMATDNAASITGLDGRVTDVENTMVTESELAQEVSSIISDIIASKIALIVSDINTIVANAIGVALASYDTSTVVDNKIATATESISVVEAVAIVEQYF